MEGHFTALPPEVTFRGPIAHAEEQRNIIETAAKVVRRAFIRSI
jgi:hypothetical protein